MKTPSSLNENGNLQKKVRIFAPLTHGYVETLMAILTVPKVLREKLGDEGVEALINLLNEAAHHERNNLLGIVEERFRGG